MSDPINDGGSAFPLQEHGDSRSVPGMSLRAYIATEAMKMPGLTDGEAGAAEACGIVGLTMSEYIADGYQGYRKLVAKRAVQMADALIAELNKPPTQTQNGKPQD